LFIVRGCQKANPHLSRTFHYKDLKDEEGRGETREKHLKGGGEEVLLAASINTLKRDGFEVAEISYVKVEEGKDAPSGKKKLDQAP